MNQNYNLSWSQPLTAFWRIGVSYRANIFSNWQAGSSSSDRRQAPTVNLTYARGFISGRFGFSQEHSSGAFLAQNVDRTVVNGSLFFRPRLGPEYSVSVYRGTDVTQDTSVFGRDTITSRVDFQTRYRRSHWDAGYDYQNSRLNNERRNFLLTRRTHRADGRYNNSFFDRKLTLSATMRGSRIRQDQEAFGDGALFDPIPAVAGLFAVDTTPEEGELEPVAELTDNVTSAPTIPRIEIGGANTFRNIGVDLGLTQQVSMLEVTVDAISAPTLQWLVFHSQDNLVWTPLGGVASQFDPAFLRYTIRFPQITDRFIKVVNVSVNAETEVAVTEIRAFLEISAVDVPSRRFSSLRTSFAATLKPAERVEGTFTMRYDNDQGSQTGFSLSDSRDLAYDGTGRIWVTDTLRVDLGVEHAKFRREGRTVLDRTDTAFNTRIEYKPNPGLWLRVTGSTYAERENRDLIQRSNLFSGRVNMYIFKELRLDSTLEYGLTQNPFAKYDRTGWRWTARAEGRPRDPWRIIAGINQSWYNSEGDVPLSRRSAYDVQLDWEITDDLQFGGLWNYGREGGFGTYSQGYRLSFSPERNFSLSLGYQQSGSRSGSKTSSTSLGSNYLFSRYLNAFVSFTSSGSRQASVSTDRVTSFQFGVSSSL